MTSNDSPLSRIGAAFALAALLITATAFDPHGGIAGVDGSLAAKRAVLEIAFVLGAAFSLLGFARRGAIAVEWRRADLLVVAFVILAALSVTWARAADDSQRDARVWIAAAGCAVLLRGVAVTTRGAWIVLSFFVGGALLAALVDSTASVLREGPSIAGAAKFASVLFPHKNVAALAYAPAAGVALALALGLRGRGRWLAASAFGLLLVATALLASRAALIGIVAGPVVFFAFERALARWLRRERSRGAQFAALAALAAGGVAAVLIPRLEPVSAFLKESFNRFVTLTGVPWETAYMRVSLWKNTFALWEESPWLGIGLANFQYELPRFDAQLPLKPHAHNQFMQLLAELGVVGLALFVALLVLAFVAAARAAIAADGDPSSPRRDSRAVARATGFGLAVFALQSVFEPPLLFPFAALSFFTLFAVATRDGAAPQLTIQRSKLLRYALLPGLAAGLAILALPRSILPLVQVEAMRAGLRHEAAMRSDEAESRLRCAAAIGYDHFEIHRALGALEARRGHLEPALERYARAAELFPALWTLHLEMAVCLLDLGRVEPCLASLDRAERLMPSAREIRFWRGRALLKAGRLDEAITVLEAHRETIAENAEILRSCADARYQRARRDRSLVDAAASLSLYERYVAVGGPQGGGWVAERIAQLGHWQNLGRVEVEGGDEVVPEPRGESDFR
jgi:O-antigen ligase